MRQLILIGVAVALIGLLPAAVQSADASGAWNQVAASYNFNTTYGGAMNSTFAQNYHGSNFSADFNAILNAVAQAMGTFVPPLGGDDILNTSLQNWPDP